MNFWSLFQPHWLEDPIGSVRSNLMLSSDVELSARQFLFCAIFTNIYYYDVEISLIIARLIMWSRVKNMTKYVRENILLCCAFRALMSQPNGSKISCF